MIFTLILVAIFVGALMPLQVVVNGDLSRLTSNSYLAAFVSFATGAIALGIILLFRGAPAIEFKKLLDAPPQLFIGGIFGVLFVLSSIYLVPRIGSTMMFMAFITGQVLTSVIIDHFGLFGLSKISLNVTRSLGIILLFAGLFLVIKKPS